LVSLSIKSGRNEPSAVANIILMVLHATFGVGVYMILSRGATSVNPAMESSERSGGNGYIGQ
jgi:hypothetical protein